MDCRCLGCLGLSASSRVPIKRYNLYVKDLFLKVPGQVKRVGVTLDRHARGLGRQVLRKIGKLTDYAHKNPDRIPKIARRLETATEKALRKEDYDNVNVSMHTYIGLLRTCGDNTALFAKNMFNLVHKLIAHQRGDMQLLAAETLLCYLRAQRDLLEPVNLQDMDPFVPRLALLAQGGGGVASDDEEKHDMAVMGLQCMRELVRLMGKTSKLTDHLQTVVPTMLYGLPANGVRRSGFPSGRRHSRRNLLQVEEESPSDDNSSLPEDSEAGYNTPPPKSGDTSGSAKDHTLTELMKKHITKGISTLRRVGDEGLDTVQRLGKEGSATVNRILRRNDSNNERSKKRMSKDKDVEEEEEEEDDEEDEFLDKTPDSPEEAAEAVLLALGQLCREGATARRVMEELLRCLDQGHHWKVMTPGVEGPLAGEGGVAGLCVETLLYVLSASQQSYSLYSALLRHATVGAGLSPRERRAVVQLVEYVGLQQEVAYINASLVFALRELPSTLPPPLEGHDKEEAGYVESGGPDPTDREALRGAVLSCARSLASRIASPSQVMDVLAGALEKLQANPSTELAAMDLSLEVAGALRDMMAAAAGQGEQLAPAGLRLGQPLLLELVHTMSAPRTGVPAHSLLQLVLPACPGGLREAQAELLLSSFWHQASGGAAPVPLLAAIDGSTAMVLAAAPVAARVEAVSMALMLRAVALDDGTQGAAGAVPEGGVAQAAPIPASRRRSLLALSGSVLAHAGDSLRCPGLSELAAAFAPCCPHLDWSQGVGLSESKPPGWPLARKEPYGEEEEAEASALLADPPPPRGVEGGEEGLAAAIAGALSMEKEGEAARAFGDELVARIAAPFDPVPPDQLRPRRRRARGGSAEEAGGSTGRRSSLGGTTPRSTDMRRNTSGLRSYHSRSQSVLHSTTRAERDSSGRSSLVRVTDLEDAGDAAEAGQGVSSLRRLGAGQGLTLQRFSHVVAELSSTEEGSRRRLARALSAAAEAEAESEAGEGPMGSVRDVDWGASAGSGWKGGEGGVLGAQEEGAGAGARCGPLAHLPPVSGSGMFLRICDAA